MAGQPKKRAKREAAAKKAPAKKAPAPVEVAPVEAPYIEPEADETPLAEPTVTLPSTYIEPEPSVVASRRVVSFSVPHPGFIPDDATIVGVPLAGSPSIIRGFVPDDDPALAAAKAADPSFGKCEWCDADFSDRKDPQASLAAHKRAKHK